MAQSKKPQNISELKKSGYIVSSVKEEMRKNLLLKLKKGEVLFPGIIGYDRTVIPALQNAILSKHDFILLGLRGQAKTRILRSLVNFLDDEIPAISGCEINDNPFSPICKSCKKKIKEKGEDVELVWISREERFQEKLATPDVTIADLIGDIDPIKAASERLSYSDEEVIHYGIIPRTNRGIFAINELPDLPPRIQVGLLNIMEERDIQIRGFPVRMPIDILIVYSANPEDYTNRGNIITPLRDRIDSQIMTHYPETMEDAISITSQEAWIKRDSGISLEIPTYFDELIEEIAFQARKSEFVDQKSGVSARLPISAKENLISNMERRAALTGDKKIFPRVCDIYATLPAISGKIELVYEGEQEGSVQVAKRLIGQAINKLFSEHFPKTYTKKKGSSSDITKTGELSKYENKSQDNSYKEILDWFSKGNSVLISDEMPQSKYIAELERVKGLKEIAKQYFPLSFGVEELGCIMELVLEGLHQNAMLAKENPDQKTTSYRDMLETMLRGIGEHT